MSAIVKVDGWVVEEHEGAWSVRDIELAEKVGLAQPRDIRRAIAKILADGAVKIGAVAAPANDEPTVWLESVQVTSGKGRIDTVDAYRLNRAAALLICTRLRTKNAIDITLAIVRVFDAVLSGRAALVPVSHPPPPETPRAIGMAPERRAELLLECVRLMSPAVSAEAKDAVIAHATAFLTGGRAEPLLPALAGPRWLSPTQIGALANRTPNAVGRAIARLGLKGGAHSKTVMNTKAHSDGQVPSYLYNDSAIDLILAELNSGPAAVAPQGGV